MSETVYRVAAASFEAARQVEILPQGHASRRLHGHSFLAKVRARLTDNDDQTDPHAVERLRQGLQEWVAPLDYHWLNEIIDIPTDENIVRWIRDRAGLNGGSTIGVQSTQDQGADIDACGHAHIWRRFRFEAAHQLPNVPPGHKCGRLHGHGFEVILHADQDLGEQHLGVDFDMLEVLWRPLQAQLNRRCLNQIPGLENPTSEMIAAWIWQQLKCDLPELSWVTVYETKTAGCHFDGLGHRIWKEFPFESAIQYSRTGDAVILGHSYVARLHLSATLDEVMGWTVDYGDVKSLFKPRYEQLDHHLLNDVDGMESVDALGVARWIQCALRSDLPQLDRVDVFETPGCGALLAWGAEGPALPV